MNKKIVIAVLSVLFVSALYAQRRNGLIGHRSESAGYLMFSTGPAYCYDDPFGSLFANNFWGGHNFQTSFGYYQPVVLDDLNFGYRILGTYYNFAGQDIVGGNNVQRRVHHDNIGEVFESYQSNIFELTGRVEYHYTFGRRYRRVIPHELYAYTGLGLMTISANFPKVSGEPLYEGKKSLSPAVCLPLGVGYQYNIDRQFSVGVELGVQAAFSDLLDGYEGSHLTGVKIVNDNVSSLSFTFSYRMY